jgi:hypothetical protein
MNHPPPASSSSYRPAQPSPSYPAAAYAGDDYATIAQRSSSEYKAASPRIPQHDTREHPHNPQSYSSGTSGASSILYNDAAGDRSSTGTDLSRELASGRPDSLASLRETEARRGGGNDRRSYGSVEMEDGRVEQRQPATIAYEQRSAVPTAPYYPQQAAVVPQRVIPRPPTPPILAPAPIALPLPAPVAVAATSPRKSTSRYNLADFTFLRTLGTGSFGRVHLVRSQHNSRSYAVKVLSKDRVVKMKQVEHTNSEREMLERVRHPFLVNLWGTFKDSKNLYMVMDFVAGGELFSLLRKSQVSPSTLVPQSVSDHPRRSDSRIQSPNSSQLRLRWDSTTSTRSTSSTETSNPRTSSSVRTDTSRLPTLDSQSMFPTTLGRSVVRPIPPPPWIRD